MNSRLFVFFVILTPLFLGGGIIFLQQRRETLPVEKRKELKVEITSKAMKLTSPVFTNNQNIPSKYTCDGANINPPLAISDVPEDAKSLALVMDDPDAPAGTWVHWTLWNMDPKTKEIAENSLPSGAVEGKTSFGKPGYGGPCPPSGTHRYFFKLYALDMTLSLSNSSTKEDIEKAMAGHIIEKVELVGLYSRK